MTLPRLHSIKPDHKTLTSATAAALRQAIEQGQFQPGNQLPPELELMTLIGVSRTTLREAMRILEEQGFIVRRRGRGTYVGERSIVKDLSLNFGISEMIAQAGLAAGTRNAAVYREKAAGPAAAALRLADGALLVVVDRVRTANQRPVVWSLDYLPASLLGDRVLEAFHLESQSLYNFLGQALQIRAAHGTAQLYPMAATTEIAARLGIRRGGVLMRVTQTDYDGDDRPLVYSVEYHLPDAFVFVVNRKGPHW